MHRRSCLPGIDPDAVCCTHPEKGGSSAVIERGLEPRRHFPAPAGSCDNAGADGPLAPRPEPALARLRCWVVCLALSFIAATAGAQSGAAAALTVANRGTEAGQPPAIHPAVIQLPPDIGVAPNSLNFLMPPDQVSTQPMAIVNTATSDGQDLRYSIDAVMLGSAGGTATDVIGTTYSYSYGTALYRGDVYETTRNTTLKLIEPYLQFTGAATLSYVVYEGTSLSGTFTNLLTQTVTRTGAGAGFYASDPLKVHMKAGRFYIIAVGWNTESLTYYYDYAAQPHTVSFGYQRCGFAVRGYPLGSATPIGSSDYDYSYYNYYQRVKTRRGWLDSAPVTGSVPPGGVASVSVIADMWGMDEGLYDGALVIASNDPDENPTTVPVTLQVKIDDVLVSPTTSLDFTGPVGGPFAPATTTYTLTNRGGVAADWTTSAGEVWIDASPASGTLAPGASLVVAVRINAAAAALTAGRYTTQVGFTDQLSGMTVQRDVTLLVGQRRILAYTRYADTAQEVVNTFSAISRVGTNYGRTDLTDYTKLASALPGNDILLIPDQTYATSEQLQAIGVAWAPILVPFVENGGVVIQCGSDYGYQILSGSGLLAITGYLPVRGNLVTVADPSDPVAQGVATYTAGNGSCSYTTTGGNAVITVASRPVVINKPMGLGNVVAIGHDYYASSANQDRVIGNAVFNLPGYRDDLVVRPFGSQAASGYAGGPFNPACYTYELNNRGWGTIDWTTSATAGWLDILPASGSLAPGAVTTVTVCINAAANSLPWTTTPYPASITFTNQATGAGHPRAINLTANQGPPDIGAAPSSFTFVMAADRVASQSLAIVNTATSVCQDLRYLVGAQSTGGNGPVTDVVGSTYAFDSGTSRFRGNVYEATGSTSLRLMESYLRFTGTADLTFVVYEGTSLSGTYTKLQEQTVTRTGTGGAFYASGPLNVQTTAGRFYILAVGWKATNVDFAYDQGAQPHAVSFGYQRTGFAADSYPLGNTTPINPSGGNFHQRITTGGGWLGTAPGAGYVAPGSATPIAVTVDTTAMAEGTYAGSLLVSSNDPDTPVTTVGVTLIVQRGLDPWRDDHFSTGSISNGLTGWSSFVMNSAIAWPDHEDTVGSYRAHVVADNSHYRISGVAANWAEWMPYSFVGSTNVARVKYYLYAGGQANPHELNQVPNLRVRAQVRFAQASVLQVFNHLNEELSGQARAISAELMPWVSPYAPSIYRVDLDPVGVPYLADNASTEGIQRAVEAYSIYPQENGYIGMVESVIGTYPKAALSLGVAPSKVYSPSATDAGTLRVTSPYDIDIANYRLGSFEGAYPTKETSGVLCSYTESPAGITMDSTDVSTSVIGVVSREFVPGSTYPELVRVEPYKQYQVRWHLTSTQQSNLNTFFRMRARSLKFSWGAEF